jgi:hypothetical protein
MDHETNIINDQVPLMTENGLFRYGRRERSSSSAALALEELKLILPGDPRKDAFFSSFLIDFDRNRAFGSFSGSAKEVGGILCPPDTDRTENRTELLLLVWPVVTSGLSAGRYCI